MPMRWRTGVSGIRRMIADTLTTNRAMHGLAARAGYAISAGREDAELRG
jgi:hypothetical protein